jgi:energy-converting hydrogenase B subunit D
VTASMLAVVHPPAPSWVITLLQASLLALVAIGATMVVLVRHPVRQVVVLSIYGAVLALLFLSLQAPDVALSELAVGTVVLPLLLLLALAKIKGQQE